MAIPASDHTHKSNIAVALGLWFLAGLVLAAVSFAHWVSALNLGRPAVWTGYSLFGLILLLAAFNLRKRLSMIPLGRAFWWFQMHVIGGLLAVALYALHVRSFWPEPSYERWIASLLYFVTITGIVGYILQKVFPVRLTEGGQEIIFERVPSAVAEMRERALELATETADKFESETLFRFYSESLDWYFRRPRFLFNHVIGGRLAEHWLETRFEALNRYCSGDELKCIARIEDIAYKKSRVDRQYAHQLILKSWLLLHVPAVSGLVLLVLWHILLVNIYAL
jgi:hypothetical protein